jgi:hypothetical protein
MDFWRAVFGLVRRWSVGPPIVVVSVGLAVLAYSLVPTRYTCNATLVLTPPAAGGTLIEDAGRPSGLSNPLLNFGEGLRTAAAVIIQALNTPATHELLGGKDGATTVTIDDGSSDPNLLGTNGPFIQVVSDSRSAAGAVDAVVKVRQLVQEELMRRQEALGAPPSTFIVVVDVVSPTMPRAQQGGRVQAAGAALVLGLVFGFGGAYVVFEVLGVGRRRAVVAGGKRSRTASTDIMDAPTEQFARLGELATGSAGAGDAGVIAGEVGTPNGAGAQATTAPPRRWRHPVFGGPPRAQPSTPQPPTPPVSSVDPPHGQTPA